MMPQIAGTGRISRLALVCASAALIIAGCATTASYRPEIDSMRASLADAKAAGAETLAPEEYAGAEACLDLLTHEATEFKPIADPHAANYIGKCRVALQALKDKMAAARVAKKPAPPVQPPAEAPAAELGIYPSTGTLPGALAALPAAEAPPIPEPKEEAAPAAAPPAPAPAPREAPAQAEAPAPGPDLGIYPGTGTLAGALAALPAEAPPVPAPSEPAQAEAPAPAPAAAAVPVPPPTAPPAVAAKEPEKAKEPTLRDIFFDFDKAEIRPDAKAPLKDNVEWLQTHPKAAVTIEGHCDERGTTEYNLALGERRARTTKDFLVASGVDPKRMSTVSFGKERPFVVGHDESAWQWNRRAHFVPR